MERYCTNCRAEIPRGAEVCPACGVFAGEMFDGRTDAQKLRRRDIARRVILGVAALTAIAAAVIWLAPRYGRRRAPVPVAVTPIRVVHNRPGGTYRAPGAAISEPEAALLLRRHLTSTTRLRDECLAAVNHGYRDGGYVFTAVDSCGDVRLGRWTVDGTTKKVTRAK